MYELVKLSQNDFYINCPSKVGIVKLNENEICLIDSGSDSSNAKKVWRVIEEQGWTLKEIYITHSHADHIGGANFLQSKSGCKIYANGIENDFTNHPILEPICLYGSNPIKELKHKFLFAEQSRCELLQNCPLEVIPLSGHSLDMVGYKTPDGNIFLADSLASAETLDKYKVSYLHDVGEYLKTLEFIKTLSANKFIPSHADVTEDIVPLADCNIRVTMEIADRVCDICKEAKPFEEILKELFDFYGLTLSVRQYALVGSSLKSYLTYLTEEGRIATEIKENRLLWKAGF